MTPEPHLPSPRRIVVIGGGITGLAAAHRFMELSRERSVPLELILLEGSSHMGGVISTEQRDGFLLEGGPDSFITDKPWAIDLCRRLGLADQLIGTESTHRRSFVVKRGRLLPVPEGFQLLAPSRLWPFLVSPIFSWPGKLRMSLDWVLPRRCQESDESLAAFVERRLGREALERMAQPMIAGIYGADPRHLSLRATMPRFLEMEQTYGSVIRAMMARTRQDGKDRRKGSNAQSPTPNTGTSGARYGLFVSLRDGMQALVDALVERLPPEAVRLGTRAARVTHGRERVWRVELSSAGGSEQPAAIEADAVCVAVPAHQAAGLLETLDPQISRELAAIPYSSSTTINLAYRRGDVPHPLDGFGFVVPAVEQRALLGCTFSSVKFAGRAPVGHVLLRAFLSESSPSTRGDAAEAAVRADLRDLLGIVAEPLFALTRRHERAMPQYQVGHLDRVAAIEAAVARHPGLALAGNAYRGIGIPDCIHSGELAAERLME